MKLHSKTLAAFFIFTACLLFAADNVPESFSEVAAWKLNVEQWKMTLELENAVLSNGREVIIKIVLTNISKAKGILRHNPIPALDYDILVADTSGKPVKLTPEGEKTLNGGPVIGSYRSEVVYPSQPTYQKVDLAKFFDLSAPGKYTVTVGRHETVNRDSKPSKVISSTNFTIK